MAREYFVCPACKAEVDPETSNFCLKCGVNLLRFEKIPKRIDYTLMEYCFYCKQPGATVKHLDYLTESSGPASVDLGLGHLSLIGGFTTREYFECKCCHCDQRYYIERKNYKGAGSSETYRSLDYLVKDLNFKEIGEIQEEEGKIKFIKKC